MRRIAITLFSQRLFVDLTAGLLVHNEAFVKALLTYGTFDEYHFFFPEPAEHLFELQFGAFVASLEKPVTYKVFSRFDLPACMQEYVYEALHCGDPSMGKYIEVRDAVAKEPFPITGITHSLAYDDYTDPYSRFYLQGAQPFDCLICSSEAARTSMQRIHAHMEAFINITLESPKKLRRPQLRVIPLGVDDPTKNLSFDVSEVRAQKQGKGLTILCLSRICVHSKADLIPLMEVFSEILKEPGCENTRLLIAGSVNMEGLYLKLLAERGTVLGLDEKVFYKTNFSDYERGSILASADIFVSIPDNPQETFGIAPVEAMYARLPLVIAHWSGYGSLIEDGKEGYLIPTYWGNADSMTRFTQGTQFDLSVFYLAQSVALDRRLLKERLIALIKDADLRERMGASARERACDHYAWPHVIAQYEALWAELKEEALSSPSWKGPTGEVSHLPLYALFKNYAQKTLNEHSTLTITERGRAVLEEDHLNVYPTEIRWIDGRLAFEVLRFFEERGESDLGALFSTISLPEPLVLYHALWLIKHGHLEVVCA
jgi:glycosyltransferase involved in cell wall biosynthesis